MQISFVNHACVKIRAGDAVLLCDPWLSGPAFNDGWDLMIPTPLDVPAVMDGVTHIWISHEHPDHFSVKFFNEIAAAYRAKVTVLFQKTRDRRVVNALTAKGFRVQEVGADEVARIGTQASVRIRPNDFYDSWLWVSDGSQTLLNLNDCAIHAGREQASVRRVAERPDVLLTQFSYAAWKGGKNNSAYRIAAATAKLQAMRDQITAFAPKYVIPFASFAYFSNVDNFYLNDHVNTPRDAVTCIEEAGARPVVLFPADSWTVGTLHDSAPALEKYARVYEARSNLPQRPAGASVPVAELERQFAKYRERIWKKNSSLTMQVLRRLPFINAFRPVVVRLSDLDEAISLSIIDGFKRVPADNCEISMNSSSLAFILNNDFGYDTLTVNGRFEATTAAFSSMTRSLSVGSLNAMGLSLSPSLILHANVVVVLLRRLHSVLTRLKHSRAAAAGAERPS